jgi:uncharacterized membrane protein
MRPDVHEGRENMNTTRKVLIGIGAVPVIILGWMNAAFAAADADTVTAVGASALTLKDTLVSVGTTVLPYAAAVVALTFGWRFARKFIRG